VKNFPKDFEEREFILVSVYGSQCKTDRVTSQHHGDQFHDETCWTSLHGKFDY